MQIEKKDNGIVIISLPENYNIFTIEKFMNLLKDLEFFDSVKVIIFDLTRLKFLENFGGEVFLFESEDIVDEVAFCSLHKHLINVFEEFSQMILNKKLKLFKDLDEILNYYEIK